jgi:hypothetical protein
MYFQKDWLMRQIEMILRFIISLLFMKEYAAYEIDCENSISANDPLYEQVMRLLSEGKICEAEDLLFDNFDADNNEFLKLAVYFYATINKLSDEELEARNFSREEIKDGLHEIMKRRGINMPEMG